MSAELPRWVEAAVALLLLLSGVLALAAGVGLVRFKTFFMRMHPPALAFTLAAWCVTLANVLYFSWQGGGLSLSTWLIVVFLALTVPVTTTLLARTDLFRRRTHPQAGDDVPPPLGPPASPPPAASPAGTQASTRRRRQRQA